MAIRSLLDVLLDALAGKKGVLRKEGVTLRKVFQDGDLMAKVEGALDKAGYKTELTRRRRARPVGDRNDHQLLATTFTIDWNFASYVEFQKAVELYMTLEDDLAARSSLVKTEPAKKIATREELLEKVLAAAKKDLIDPALQRSGRDESRAALGNDNGSGKAHAPAGPDRRCGRDR